MTVSDEWSPHWPPQTADRVVVVARLKKGTHEQATELIAAGPPFEPGALGFERHAVYLSSEEVIFVLKGHPRPVDSPT